MQTNVFPLKLTVKCRSYLRGGKVSKLKLIVDVVSVFVANTESPLDLFMPIELYLFFVLGLRQTNLIRIYVKEKNDLQVS